MMVEETGVETMRQRSVHWLFAAAMGVMSAGGIAFAQPVSGPTPDAATRPDGDGQRNDGGFRRPPGWYGREVQPTNEEWDAIVAFMSQNNPVRLELLKRIEDTLGGNDQPSVIASQIKRTLSVRYRELKNLEQRRPELYSFALTRLQLEDNILGMLRDLKAPDAKKDELNAKLNVKIRQSVDNSLAERRARIDQLAAALDREKKSLADDSSKIDELVAKQRDKFEKEMNAMLDFNAQNSPSTTQTTPDAK